MPPAWIDPARPESRRAGLLDRVWNAVVRWRKKPEAARQEGPLVDVRELLWAKLQAGDLTLADKRSDVLVRVESYLKSGVFEDHRKFFDVYLDGYGTPRGPVRDEPIRPGGGRGDPEGRDIAGRAPERETEGARTRDRGASDIAMVWGVDAAGRRVREPPAIPLPPRHERTGQGRVGAEVPRAPTRGERVYLAVPFAEKDRAKAAGARWDKERKAWYAPEGRDAAAFQAWRPGQTRTPARAADPVAEFAEALRRAGLDVPRPEMDGKLHRVRVDGDKGREKSGAYVGHLDSGRPAGFIQNFKTGEKQRWRLERPEREADRAEVARAVAEREARKVAEQERLAEQHREAARTAQAVWDRALPAPDDHPYVARKGVDGRDARVGAPGQTIAVSDGRGGTRDMSVAGWLIVPAFTTDREPSSLQFISREPDGGKVFLRGGKMQGAHCIIGRMGQSPRVLVCEGWATGKTLHALTGLPVVVAFNSGNLREVAEMVHAKHPERTILVAGDNDHKREREVDPRTGKAKANVGRESALEAAAAVGGVAVLPPFRAHEKGSDWNDLAALRGPATARSVLRELVADGERARAAAAEREGANVVPFERGGPQRSQRPARRPAREGEREAGGMER